MSALYNIRVLELDGMKIRLSVEVIHPDSNHIYESPGFALMLIHYGATYDTPLGREVDFELLHNDSWIESNARGFIRSVTLEKGKPTRRGWLTGTLQIEVTHPAWLSHLQGVAEWDSAAYEPVSFYADCAPVAPDEEDDNVPDNVPATSREGFMPVWKYMVPSYLLHSNKDILWLPVYSQSSYKPDPARTITDLGEASMRAHEGLLVKTPEGYGVLHKRVDDWGMYSNGNSSCGSSYIDGEMTPMVLNTRKKLSYPMSVNDMIRWSSPLIFDAAITGDTITLKVMVMSEEDRVFLHSKVSALEFLMKPFETWRGNEYEESPLGSFLNAQMKKKGIARTWDLYMQHKDIAEGVIMDFNMEKSLDIPPPELYGLSHDEVISLYSFDKWPQYAITIKVASPALLEGYGKKLPFEHIFGSLGDHLV
ncbi:hypothetical protein [uncultured Flavobacterium sp.]|uniref:hypothetical protein n=1 Tax=uncultured Flavobacterium sp. TaxID=165435 RepID=UPI0025D64A4D|nr:hypothetical protein [uncultured Flavobacterium sp.]